MSEGAVAFWVLVLGVIWIIALTKSITANMDYKSLDPGAKNQIVSVLQGMWIAFVIGTLSVFFLPVIFQVAILIWSIYQANRVAKYCKEVNGVEEV